MNKVLPFIPSSESNAERNLKDFVVFARKHLAAFGEDLPFDDVVWDITETCARKGHGKKRQRITFCTLVSAMSRNKVPMCDAFRPFAQAYLRQMQALKPVLAPEQRLAALRALEAALTENGESMSPTRVDTNILNRASQIVKNQFSVTAAYRYGIQLEIIAKYMSTHRLVRVPVHWRNPLKRPSGLVKIGEEFDEARASKMPSSAALEALPHIFRNAARPRDVMVSSIAAILCSAPDRANEVLMLPEACEVKVPRDGQVNEAFGLRWWPAKGAAPMVKWIVPSMVGVVREALARIRRITEPARLIAKWYEAHPNQIFLPPDCEHLRSQDVLSMAELSLVLWGDAESAPAAKIWCKTHKIPIAKSGGLHVVPFVDVEGRILRMLPDTFPLVGAGQGLKYSEALMVVPTYTFHRKWKTYICVIEPVSIQHINDGLGTRTAAGIKSIFDDFGFVEEDGLKVRVTSHQFRHYLNTLAQTGGLSQLDIAKWSGRKDVRQNEAYNHMNANEMVVLIREAVGDFGKALGPLGESLKTLPIRRDEFARLLIPTAHTTEIGYCVHDYTMAPCQMHRDCINCQEHVCVKGNESKTVRLRTQLEEAEALLIQASAAVKEGYIGSDRWMEHHAVTVDRLRTLCEIMDDPKIPVGTVIQLSNVRSPSRIEQANSKRAERLTQTVSQSEVPGDGENPSGR